MRLGKDTVEALWREFGDVPVNDQGEILESFCGWPAFTDREEIWRWFDEQYAQFDGVHALMFPGEHEKRCADRCPVCGAEQDGYRDLDFGGPAGGPTQCVFVRFTCGECGREYVEMYAYDATRYEGDGELDGDSGGRWKHESDGTQ